VTTQEEIKQRLHDAGEQLSWSLVRLATAVNNARLAGIPYADVSAAIPQTGSIRLSSINNQAVRSILAEEFK